MSVIDLTAARATWAANLQAAREMTATAVAGVKELAEHYADIAFSFSGPVRLVNEQLAVDINRSQLRRVVSIVRGMTRQGVPEVRQQFHDLAGDAFAARLDHLIREQDRRRGVVPGFEVVGGLWISKNRDPYKAPPWPCAMTLGRLGTLSWMTHIEHTPYRMRPATRATFDAARKKLQANPVEVAVMSPEQERVVDRIIRTCWERGWRPEERVVA